MYSSNMPIFPSFHSITAASIGDVFTVIPSQWLNIAGFVAYFAILQNKLVNPFFYLFIFDKSTQRRWKARLVRK